MADRPAGAADVTLILVTYNSAGILSWSLPALAECAHVVIVDNRSSDDTLAVARRLLPHARIIEAGRNLGFGRANNLGLLAATTPYALLLNPDSRLHAGALDALCVAAKRYPRAAIFAPVLYDAPGVVGDFFRGPYFAPRSDPAPEPAGDLCAEFVTGAAMFIRLHPLREIGFFDPWFFLYFEDDDLCLRVRRAGHSIVVVHDASVEHHVRHSSPASIRTTFRRSYCMTLSKFYITRKYFGRGRCAAMALRVGLGSMFALLPQLLLLRRERLLRHLARVGAALFTWRHLRRRHCFEPAD